MKTLNWTWDNKSRLHMLYDGNTVTGYRIEPPGDGEDEYRYGLFAWKFNCILPGGDANVTYDTLEEAKLACEDMYDLIQYEK